MKRGRPSESSEESSEDEYDLGDRLQSLLGQRQTRVGRTTDIRVVTESIIRSGDGKLLLPPALVRARHARDLIGLEIVLGVVGEAGLSDKLVWSTLGLNFDEAQNIDVLRVFLQPQHNLDITDVDYMEMFNGLDTDDSQELAFLLCHHPSMDINLPYQDNQHAWMCNDALALMALSMKKVSMSHRVFWKLDDSAIQKVLVAIGYMRFENLRVDVHLTDGSLTPETLREWQDAKTAFLTLDDRLPRDLWRLVHSYMSLGEQLHKAGIIPTATNIRSKDVVWQPRHRWQMSGWYQK
jgi:hypothetical protein